MNELDAVDKIATKAFEGFVVRKDLVRKFKGQYPVPTYVAEFLLGRYCASVDDDEIAEGLKIVERQLGEKTVRAGEHETIRWSFVLRVTARRKLGATAAYPHAMLGGLRDEKLRRGPALGFNVYRPVDNETGGEHLGEQHQASTTSSRSGDHWRQAREVRVAVVPNGVVLHSCDTHRAIVRLAPCSL